MSETTTLPSTEPTPAPAKAEATSRVDEARAAARKLWARGRERWTALAPRAKELSAKARTRARTIWHDQVAGARAGLARVRAVFHKPAA